jgi:ankyrin repeat protein
MPVTRRRKTKQRARKATRRRRSQRKSYRRGGALEHPIRRNNNNVEMINNNNNHNINNNDGYNGLIESMFHGLYENNYIVVDEVLGAFDGAVHERDEDGRTPLMVAVMQGNVELVELILTYRPDLRAVDANGNDAFALVNAAQYGVQLKHKMRQLLAAADQA